MALSDAVNKTKWSNDDETLKIIFLVGDAPPHMDYDDGLDYKDICKEAVKHEFGVRPLGKLGACVRRNGSRLTFKVQLLSFASLMPNPKNTRVVILASLCEFALECARHTFEKQRVFLGGQGGRHQRIWISGSKF